MGDDVKNFKGIVDIGVTIKFINVSVPIKPPKIVLNLKI